jgi:hypothetical protein
LCMACAEVADLVRLGTLDVQADTARGRTPVASP